MSLLTIAFVAMIEVTHRDAYSDGRHTAEVQAQQGPNGWVFQLVPQAESPWHDTYAQWAMAFFAFLATGASVLAVYLLYGTLIATRDLLDQARKSTDAATIAARATEQAALAATEANELQSKMFIDGNRARVDGHPLPDSPLQWDQGSKVGRVTFKFILKNTGKSDAKNVAVSTRFVFDRDKIAEALQEMKSKRPSIGAHVESGKPVTLASSVVIKRSELDALARTSGERMAKALWTQPIPVKPILVYCVSYQLTLNDQWKFTWAARLIGSKRRENKSIGPYWGDVPAEDFQYFVAWQGDGAT